MWEKVLKFVTTNPLGAALRVFVFVVAGLWFADIKNAGYFHVDLSEWGPWVWAGIIAALPVVAAFFNPQDSRFGVGS